MVHFGTARSDHYQGKQVFLLVKEWVFIFHYARSPIELYIQNFSAQAFEGNIVAKMELVELLSYSYGSLQSLISSQNVIKTPPTETQMSPLCKG